MAYVKLDTAILDSTLWIERESREVFITALLLAEPFEALESLPQIAVRSLDLTGFLVPPGWYGFVQAAGSGIVRRALVDTELGMAALERLGNPDYESRNPKFEGRRLVRVNHGFIVLNYMEFRDRDHTSAARSRRYRERQEAKKQERRDGVTDTAHHGVPSRDITEAVSSKQEAVSSKSLTTQHNTGAVTFLSESHKPAYLAIRATSRNPDSLDAVLVSIHEPVSGGAAYSWEVIGQALLELHATGGAVTPNGIRAFCRKLTEKPRAANGALDWKQPIPEAGA